MQKCLKICEGMNFKVSHISRAGNHCANLGVENKLDFIGYSMLPPCISWECVILLTWVWCGPPCFCNLFFYSFLIRFSCDGEMIDKFWGVSLDA